MTRRLPPATAKPAEFARIAGFKPGYITQLKRENRLVLDDAGLILVADSLARIRATSDPSKAGVAARHAEARHGVADAPEAGADADDDTQDAESPSPAVSGPGRDFHEARARKEHFLALAAERDYLQSMGELLPLADVQAVVSQAAVSLRTRLEAMPDTLAPQLGAETDEARCRALLAEAIEHTLDEAARALRGLMPPEGGE